MRSARLGSLVGLGLLLASVHGCGQVSVLNPDLFSSLGLSSQSASLPGDAPGLLVRVTNSTGRTSQIVVSYRDEDSSVQSYTVTVGPGDSTARMLVCPIEEITVGNVSDLEEVGAVVYLADGAVSAEQADLVPFVEVDSFGLLLREEVNYDCGDAIEFTLRVATSAQSGYQVVAVVDRATTE